jgi:fimbrial isopeptide formation D2 family protein/LPXTG-motif cell wall-anchored protein
MKKTSKILALVLVVAMVVAMGVGTVAFAATLNVENAVDGQKYVAYKLLNYEKNGNTWTYYLEANDTSVKTFLEGYGMVFSQRSSDNAWVLQNSDEIDAATLAAALKAADSITALDTITIRANGTSASFDDLDQGYYFITSTTGTLVTLTSFDDAETVFDKNTTTVLDKTATGDYEVNNSDENDVNSASIGDTLTYTVTFTIKPGAENYVFKDTLSTGLSLEAQANLTVSDDAGALDTKNYAVSDWTVGDGGTIKIDFAQAYLDTITEDTVITITYKATINENALDAGSAENDAHLSYGENNDIDTGDKVKTYFGDIEIFKHNSANDGLGGAEFTITDEDGTAIKVSEATAGTAGDYNVDPNGNATITSGEDGYVKIHGLRAGTYTIEETKAPEDYNILNGTATATITVSSTGEVTATVTNGEADVLNQNGAELPETGGIGTTIFYVVGAILVVGAVVILVTRRRMRAR